VNWYLQGVHNKKIDPTPVLFNNNAWLKLSGYVNFQNNVFPMLIYKLMLHVFKVFVWCVVSANRNIEPIVRCQIK
jgi:hypothetical protein